MCYFIYLVHSGAFKVHENKIYEISQWKQIGQSIIKVVPLRVFHCYLPT